MSHVVVKKFALSSGTRQSSTLPPSLDSAGTTSTAVTSAIEGNNTALVATSIENKVEVADSLTADMAPSGAYLNGHEDRYLHSILVSMFLINSNASRRMHEQLCNLIPFPSLLTHCLSFPYIPMSIFHFFLGSTPLTAPCLSHHLTHTHTHKHIWCIIYVLVIKMSM